MNTLLRMQTACEIAAARDRHENIMVKRHVEKPPTAGDGACPTLW
jgi:hypothetical protein